MIRKRISTLIYLTPLLLFHASAVTAQGLYVTGGTHLVLNGSSNLVLQNCDLTNNGFFDAGNTSTVIFRGNAASTTINGPNFTLGNLAIDKSAGDLLLNTSVAVGGNLDMMDGVIQLNNNNIDLGNTGMIVGESSNSYITGVTGGLVLRQENLNAPTASNPGNIGVEITTASNLGLTQIARGHVPQTGTSAGIGIARYFDITPANNAGLNGTLTIQYLDHELGGIAENELAMSARDISFGYWDLLGVDAANTTANFVTKNTIDTFGRFTLTSSVNDPLPLTLLSFTGTLVHGQSHLKWEVANELTILKYDVERSADGKNFTRLGTLLANGRLSDQHKYSYIDFEPFKDITYYRLKVYDNRGRGSYTRIVRVELTDNAAFSVYPNPVTEKMFVTFYSDEEKTAEMTIIDNHGKVVAKKQVQCTAGANKVEWNISSLASATYYLKLDGFTDATVKLIKL